MQRRFRKEAANGTAEIWVDVGHLRYRVELYEHGKFVKCERGWKKSGEMETFLLGRDFSALVHFNGKEKIRCTWPR